MKYQSLFSGKNKKKIFQNVICWNFYSACRAFIAYTIFIAIYSLCVWRISHLKILQMHITPVTESDALYFVWWCYRAQDHPWCMHVVWSSGLWISSIIIQSIRSDYCIEMLQAHALMLCIVSGGCSEITWSHASILCDPVISEYPALWQRASD